MQRATSPHRLGAPTGVLALCATILFQRLSYFGGRGLLILFLSTGVPLGGFGWSEPESLRFFGLFVGLYLATPLIGGAIADRFLGMQRSTAFGNAVMASGYILLAIAIATPNIASGLLGAPTGELLRRAGIAFGKLSLGSTDWQLILKSAGNVQWAQAARLAYLTTSYLFYAAICLIVIGNGFFQSCSLSLVGSCYADDDPRRDVGYTYEYVAVSVGAIIGVLAVGTVGEKIAFTTGFAVAGLSGFFAILFFEVLRRRHLVGVCVEPKRTEGNAGTALSSLERDRVSVIAVMVLFALVFTIAFEQFSGLVALYARNSTDRLVGSFEIPATWFPQLGSVFAVILGAWYIRVAQRLSDAGRNPSTPVKFAIGLFLTLLPCVLMIGAVVEAQADGRSHMIWLVGAYFLLTAGEVVLWPTGYSMVAKLAPARFSAAALGIWLLVAASLGSWLAGQVGAAFLELGVAEGFGVLMLLLAVSAIVLLAVRGWLVRRADDAVFAGQSSDLASQAPTAGEKRVLG